LLLLMLLLLLLLVFKKESRELYSDDVCFMLHTIIITNPFKKKLFKKK